jgi:hypothetical protein
MRKRPKVYTLYTFSKINTYGCQLLNGFNSVNTLHFRLKPALLLGLTCKQVVYTLHFVYTPNAKSPPLRAGFYFWAGRLVLRVKREPLTVHSRAAVHGWAVLTYAVRYRTHIAPWFRFRFGVSVVVNGYPDAAGEQVGV